MISSFRKLLRGKPEAPLPAIPDGERVFAIGDIHGRLDLFTALIAAVEAQDERRGPAHTTIILLGDLIDRGPDSAGVLTRARDWQASRTARGHTLRILMGNHEEMLLEALDRVAVLRSFVTHGGKETILSFGVDPQAFIEATWDEVQAMFRAAMPADIQRFILGFEHMVRIGDYAFVHAGVRPGQPLETQTPADLRWIREPFLSSDKSHGAVIVHGHTITDQAVLRPNRIGIDTGAYDSGQLTALMLEGTERWLLSTAEVDGQITTNLRPAV